MSAKARHDLEFYAQSLWAADARKAISAYIKRERANEDRNPRDMPLWPYPGPKTWSEVAPDVQQEYRERVLAGDHPHPRTRELAGELGIACP